MANNDCNNVTFFFIFSSTKISLKNKLFSSDAFSTFSTKSLDAKRRVNAIASKEEALLPLRTCVKRFQVKKKGGGGGSDAKREGGSCPFILRPGYKKVS